MTDVSKMLEIVQVHVRPSLNATETSLSWNDHLTYYRPINATYSHFIYTVQHVWTVTQSRHKSHKSCTQTVTPRQLSVHTLTHTHGTHRVDWDAADTCSHARTHSIVSQANTSNSTPSTLDTVYIRAVLNLRSVLFVQIWIQTHKM